MNFLETCLAMLLQCVANGRFDDFSYYCLVAVDVICCSLVACFVCLFCLLACLLVCLFVCLFVCLLLFVVVIVVVVVVPFSLSV